MAVELRRVGPEDHELATGALRALGEPHGECETFLSRGEVRCYVAIDEGTVVGCAYGHELVHPDGQRTMLLYALKVAPSHFGRGVARSLAAAFAEGARDEGCTEAWALTDAGKVGDTTTYVLAGARRDPESALVFVWPFADPEGHAWRGPTS